MTTFARKKAGGKGPIGSGSSNIMSKDLLKEKHLSQINEVKESSPEPTKRAAQKSALSNPKYKEKSSSNEVCFLILFIII